MRNQKIQLGTFCIVILLLIGLSGCKKKKEEINWPQGFSGRFALSVSGIPGNGVLILDETGIKEHSSWSIASNADVQWSHDGTKLLATGPYGDFVISDVYGNRIKYFEEGNSPIWSQEGTMIAYTKFLGPPRWEGIYTVNSEGSDLMYFNKILEGSPLGEWSPDKKKISIFTWGEYSRETDSIGCVDSNGYTLLTHGYNPVWSNNGLQLYFYKDSAVWSYTLSDHSIKRMARLGQDFAYCWSPDKTMLAYTFFSANQSDIYLVKMDGSASVNLTNYNENHYFDTPCWSVDGTKIVCSYDHKGLAIINSDGSNPIYYPSLPEVNGVPFHGYIWEITWH